MLLLLQCRLRLYFFFANCRSGFFLFFFYYCCFLQCKHIKQNHETFYVEQKKRFLVVASDCIACYCYIGFICFAFVYIRFMCVCAYVGCIVITIVYKKNFFFKSCVWEKREVLSDTFVLFIPSSSSFVRYCCVYFPSI